MGLKKDINEDYVYKNGWIDTVLGIIALAIPATIFAIAVTGGF